MYITIWDLHIEGNDKPSRDADDADIAEIERAMHTAHLDSICDDDYDPFDEEEGAD